VASVAETKGEGEPEPSAPETPVFRIMDVLSVTLDLPEQYPVVTLQETEGTLRQLAFPVGLPEGNAIAYALRKLETPRPLTHELFASTLRRLGVDVIAVRLIGRTRGTFMAELDLMGPQGHHVLECRPTDGIALAVRQSVRAPILADERLLATDGDVAPIPRPPPAGRQPGERGD
jgi:bifunctional DNase/RNase